MSNITTATPPRKAGVAQKLAVLVTGYGFMRVLVWLFDEFLYGFVSAYSNITMGSWWGNVATFAIMAPLSALICLGMLKAYDYLKVDWFGLETLKELKEQTEGGGFIRRSIRYLLKKGDWTAFVTLSIIADPFMVTVYLRRGKYNGMSSRDRKIFWGSVVFSNIYWTIRWAVIIEVLFWILPVEYHLWIADFFGLAEPMSHQERVGA